MSRRQADKAGVKTPYIDEVAGEDGSEPSFMDVKIALDKWEKKRGLKRFTWHDWYDVNNKQKNNQSTAS